MHKMYNVSCNNDHELKRRGIKTECTLAGNMIGFWNRTTFLSKSSGR